MRIDFPELGEGYFVEIKNPKLLKWGEQKAITSAMKDDSMSSHLDVAERVAIALVKSGYILDDENKPIAFPLNEKSIFDIPSVVVESVAKAFADAKTGDTGKN